MPDRKKRISYTIVILIHCVFFILLYIFFLNKKYYGFESSIQIESFVLEDHRGETFSKKDLENHFHFIYIGFLHCTGVCPKGVSLLTQLAKEIPDPDLRFVFVSIDPTRDTKESLFTYIQNRDPRFIGLRHSDLEKIENFVGQFHFTFSREIFSQKKTSYQIHHPSPILLLDKSLTKLIRYPEGLDQVDRIKKDYLFLKVNH